MNLTLLVHCFDDTDNDDFRDTRNKASYEKRGFGLRLLVFSPNFEV